MKNLKIFPKMFIQVFAMLGLVTLLIHVLIFINFPKTYLDSRKAEIQTQATEISKAMDGKDPATIEEALKLYSDTSEIKASLTKGPDGQAKAIEPDLDLNFSSQNNSLIIEERKIHLATGEPAYLQFLSVADMQQEAKDLSLGFLPYSLSISLLFSLMVALVYAKVARRNIQEIKKTTDAMMTLDPKASFAVDSKDEIGQLKEQINSLYFTLLHAIEDNERKNQDLLRLEKLKNDFFRGASHELKTPLASLKIILENMKYRIGKYKDRDYYIDACIDTVDELTGNISQILTVASLEKLKDDEKTFQIQEVLEPVLNNYQVLISQKNLQVHNQIQEEKITLGKTAFKIILSNLISNAVKYSPPGGEIVIGVEDHYFFIKNTFDDQEPVDLDHLMNINFDLNNQDSHGLGLYIVHNLLNNYGKTYEVTIENGYFIFKIFN